MGINMSFSGFHSQMKKYETEGDKETDAALHAEAMSVFADTQAMVPKKTGALAASGRVDEGSGKNPEYTIHYGDSQVDGVGVYYAAAVHDRFAKHDNGQAKYVETPLMQHDFKPAIEKAIRKATS